MTEKTTQCRMCLEFFDPHSVHMTFGLHDGCGHQTAELSFCPDCSVEAAEGLPAEVKEKLLVRV